MKGFPNQVADLPTLTKALRVVDDLSRAGQNARDDGVYGETLIRRGILGTGHKPIPVNQYLAQQKAIKSRSNQSYRTRARQLRELFRILDLITDADVAALTSAGRQIAAIPAGPLDAAGLRLWRTAILNMTHEGGDDTASHPYQVLLRLVANRPGITRAKCALALEARDDSEAELARITALSDLSESAILAAIGVTKSNWDNAKKILPHFAEQLGDVMKLGESFSLADSPGASPPPPPVGGAVPPPVPHRKASRVTPDTIAATRKETEWDEVYAAQADPQKAAETKKKITARFNRHQAVVKAVGQSLAGKGATLFEMPFDCFAQFPQEAVLVEVKSLDGTAADEQERVREALAQLLYYESFATRTLIGERHLKKVACFEGPITVEHAEFLAKCDIHAIWRDGVGFGGRPAARSSLSGHFGF